MTVHNGDLNHAILAAVHTDVPHASVVSFEVVTRGRDGAPTLYRVIAWRDGFGFTAQATTPTEGLTLAMGRLKAAAEVTS